MSISDDFTPLGIPLETIYTLKSFSNYSFTGGNEYTTTTKQTAQITASRSIDEELVCYHYANWNTLTVPITSSTDFPLQHTFSGRKHYIGFDLHLCKRDGEPKHVELFFTVNKIDERWPYNEVLYTTDDWKTVKTDGVVERNGLNFHVIVPEKAQAITVGTNTERNVGTRLGYQLTSLEILVY